MKYLNKPAIAVFVFGVVCAGVANAATISTDDVVDSLGWTQTQINQQNYDRDDANRIDIGTNRTDIINMQNENLLRDDEIKNAAVKADAAQTGVNANAHLITILNQKVDDNTAGQTITDSKQDILINDTENKADQALQQNVVNGSNIATLQTDVGNLKTDISSVDQEAKQAGALSATANNKADTALQGVAKNGADIVAVDAKANSATTLATIANTNALAADAKATTANTLAISAKAAADHAEITATDANNKADANTAAIATKVDTNTFNADQDRQDKTMQATSDKATQGYNTGVYAQSLAVDAETVSAANKAAVANVQSRQQAQETTIQNHSAQLANHEQRITTLENQNNAKFSSLENQQNEDRKEYRAGIAGAASIAGLHYVNTDNAVAVGAANFKDAQGYAIGYRHKFAENVAATLSTSGTSNGDEIVAASASIGW